MFIAAGVRGGRQPSRTGGFERIENDRLGTLKAATVTGPETLEQEDAKRLIGLLLAGRYRLTRLIDRGGFGAVYEAVDERLDGKIRAIKIGTNPNQERHFATEAKLASNLDHPHVVQVYDYGIDGELPYMVMEFLRGQSLEEIFCRHGRSLPREKLCRMVKEIGSALKRAHLNHLVHRDLKPRNIMLVNELVRDDESVLERFVLLDFGIASKLDGTNTMANRTMSGAGTVEYMAPEQLAKSDGSPASDIYSFGVILYQMLAGQVPFRVRENSILGWSECAQAIVHDPPPRFNDIAPERVIHPEVEELVLECLAKRPADRPKTIADVRDRFLSANELRLTGTDRPLKGVTVRPGQLDGITRVPRHDTSAITPAKSGWQRPPSRQKRRLSAALWMVVPLLCFSVLSVGVFLKWFPGSPGSPRPLLVLNSSAIGFAPADDKSPPVLTVEAGSKETFYVDLDRTAALGREDNFTVQATVADDDGQVVVELPESVGKNDPVGTVQVPDVNTSQGLERRVLVTATRGETTQTAELLVRVAQPKAIWLPSGFHSPDGQLRKIGSRVFYRRLTRNVPGELRPVVFILIPENPERDARLQRTEALGRNPNVRTIYLMEDKVWTSLFRVFAEDQRGALVRQDSERERIWEQSPPLLPIRSVAPKEANAFAHWLGGDFGDVPSIEEWDAAAGYYDWLWRRLDGPNQPAGAEPLDVFDGPARPSSDPLPSEFYPVGEASSEISPYGIRDMGSNGGEWTRTDSDGREGLASRPEGTYIRCRGRRPTKFSPLRFAESPDDLQAYCGIQGYDTIHDEIGFRVVLIPPNQ